MAKKAKKRSTASRAMKTVTKAARSTGKAMKRMMPGRKKRKSSRR
jgi:hypothetical protein